MCCFRALRLDGVGLASIHSAYQISTVVMRPSRDPSCASNLYLRARFNGFVRTKQFACHLGSHQPSMTRVELHGKRQGQSAFHAEVAQLRWS